MQIDLRIERGRVGMPMPQKFGHLCQGSASAKQIRGEREPQQVGTTRWGAESGASQRSRDDARDGVVGAEATNGSFETNKQPPCQAPRSPPTKIGGNRRADIPRERETLLTQALAPDDDLACLPGDVVQGSSA
jgi:hypothetical protein